MYAVIKTGGKQYRVEEGQRLDVEQLAGDEVELTPVLVVDGETVLATPDQLAGVTVGARVVGETKGPKINGFTYKTKSNRATPLGPPPALHHHRDHRHLHRVKPKAAAKATKATKATDEKDG